MTRPPRWSQRSSGMDRRGGEGKRGEAQVLAERQHLPPLGVHPSHSYLLDYTHRLTRAGRPPLNRLSLPSLLPETPLHNHKHSLLPSFLPEPSITLNLPYLPSFVSEPSFLYPKPSLPAFITP
ncbi:hypothetical protein E2C01_017593 [Portunus trituberculatus]|uniref:Uncharacterized protein n=1 Tax=Portunus trituberculatus TaxID=210409 RepID=A0A5B7DSW1_PORTR|nr:hypothetical protein [Portunus trituberculatus]